MTPHPAKVTPLFPLLHLKHQHTPTPICSNLPRQCGESLYRAPVDDCATESNIYKFVKSKLRLCCRMQDSSLGPDKCLSQSEHPQVTLSSSWSHVLLPSANSCIREILQACLFNLITETQSKFKAALDIFSPLLLLCCLNVFIHIKTQEFSYMIKKALHTSGWVVS